MRNDFYYWYCFLFLLDLVSILFYSYAVYKQVFVIKHTRGKNGYSGLRRAWLIFVSSLSVVIISHSVKDGAMVIFNANFVGDDYQLPFYVVAAFERVAIFICALISFYFYKESDFKILERKEK